jgi:hypothetical protein
MGLTIDDGLGSGVSAQVVNSRLRTFSVASSLTNYMSIDQESVYTVTGVYTFAGAAATVYPLFIRNDDSNLYLIMDTISVQAINLTGGTVLPNAGAYFSIGFTQTYSSGGTDVVPINLNRTSTNVANGLFKQGNPSLAGTFVEAYRVYPIASSVLTEPVIARGDDIILGRSKSLSIRYVSDNTSGVVMTAIKFFYGTPDQMG